MCRAVALCLASSCGKIEENSVASGEYRRTVFTAVSEAVGGGAKAHNQYGCDVLWDKNDLIFVTDGDEANTFTVGDVSAGTGKGMLTEDTPHSA